MTAAQPELAAYRAEHDVSKATHFPHGADALIFEMATRNMVFGDYRVDIDGSASQKAKRSRLSATTLPLR